MQYVCKRIKLNSRGLPVFVCIFLQDQNLHSLQLKLKEELDKVNQWLQLNSLSLNIGKTNFVTFCPSQRNPQPISLKISGRPVEQTTYVKYLCLIIDCNLNWKKTYP